MRFERAGDRRDGHAHNFDHATYFPVGAALVESLNDDDSVRASTEVHAARGLNWALIKAGVRHRITALEAGTIGHCIYAHRTPQGDVVQEHTGWAPAYE
jgi:hypothetical protein